MQEQEMNLEIRNNRPEFQRRLREDLKIPEGEIGDAVLDAVTICVHKGFNEMEPLITKYGDLICPWCGALHYRVRCQRLIEDSTNEELAKKKELANQ